MLTEQEINDMFKDEPSTIQRLADATPINWNLMLDIVSDKEDEIFMNSLEPKTVTTDTEELDLAGASKEDNTVASWIDHDLWGGIVVMGATIAGILLCWNMF